MTDPITLTEREVRCLHEVAAEIHRLHTELKRRGAERIETLKAGSAPPPRVPADVGYKTAREVDYERGYRAGIEAAAKAECACCRDGVPFHHTFTNAHVLPDGTERACVAYRIRALADKPAPMSYTLQQKFDAVTDMLSLWFNEMKIEGTGNDAKYVLRLSPETVEMGRDRIAAEIAARKGG